MMTDNTFKVEGIDFIKLLSSVVPRYEEKTGNTVSDEMKALLVDFGARSILISCSKAIRELATDEHISFEHLVSTVKFINEKMVYSLSKSLKEAKKVYPATWR